MAAEQTTAPHALERARCSYANSHRQPAQEGTRPSLFLEHRTGAFIQGNRTVELAHGFDLIDRHNDLVDFVGALVIESFSMLLGFADVAGVIVSLIDRGT